MDEQDFQERTKQLAARVIRLVDALPQTRAADEIGRQVLDSVTSIGTNYRASCRATTKTDTVNGLKVVEDKAAETLYWLELMIEAEIMAEARLGELMSDTEEVIALAADLIKAQRSKKS